MGELRDVYVYSIAPYLDFVQAGVVVGVCSSSLARAIDLANGDSATRRKLLEVCCRVRWHKSKIAARKPPLSYHPSFYDAIVDKPRACVPCHHPNAMIVRRTQHDAEGHAVGLAYHLDCVEVTRKRKRLSWRVLWNFSTQEQPHWKTVRWESDTSDPESVTGPPAWGVAEWVPRSEARTVELDCREDYWTITTRGPAGERVVFYDSRNTNHAWADASDDDRLFIRRFVDAHPLRNLLSVMFQSSVVKH